ncbi:MAG: homoserine O-acetyltransferase [Steroidobacteraceae bacterium]|jgi:homoserine O-acetyltransferase|nr:homoserine O-acetyltransferase [Steroidobacteraceae bacterium]
MTSARKILRLDRPFEMRRGGALHGVEIAYETWGDARFRHDKAILIFTGLSPSAHAASSTEDAAPGWWEDMIGPGRPIDTRRYFVICVNSLGSPFGSTSPISINPATGQPYRLTFPVLTVEDIARAGYEVALSLGIKKLACVIGPSLGGMTVLAYCAQFPGATRGMISISASARSAPFSIALRSLQREIIRRDPAWCGGAYQADAMPVQGMRLARKLGMITYRSAKEWALRFGRERATVERQPGDPFGIDFEVEAYLENHAAKFTGQFDPNCYLYLSRAMDLFDLADHGGSVSAALARFTLERALIIGVETDLLFPIEQQQELADGLAAGAGDVQFARLDSLQGHDSFLVDMDRFRPVIAEFLRAL